MEEELPVDFIVMLGRASTTTWRTRGDHDAITHRTPMRTRHTLAMWAHGGITQHNHHDHPVEKYHPPRGARNYERFPCWFFVSEAFPGGTDEDWQKLFLHQFYVRTERTETQASPTRYLLRAVMIVTTVTTVPCVPSYERRGARTKFFE